MRLVFRPEVKGLARVLDRDRVAMHMHNGGRDPCCSAREYGGAGLGGRRQGTAWAAAAIHFVAISREKICDFSL
jgi:hypothetical protein